MGTSLILVTTEILLLHGIFLNQAVVVNEIQIETILHMISSRLCGMLKITLRFPYHRYGANVKTEGTFSLSILGSN